MENRAEPLFEIGEEVGVKFLPDSGMADIDRTTVVSHYWVARGDVVTRANSLAEIHAPGGQSLRMRDGFWAYQVSDLPPGGYVPERRLRKLQQGKVDDNEFQDFVKKLNLEHLVKPEKIEA